MVREDDRRFGPYDVLTELIWCGREAYNRKSITNDNIRFQAWLCRAAADLLKGQKVKTGYWVLDDEDTDTWECSKCGALQIIFDVTPFDNSWFYCPRCGCKMERQVSRDGKTGF